MKLTCLWNSLLTILFVTGLAARSLAQADAGTVRTWGGTTAAPAGLKNVVGISAGGTGNLAVKADGTVVSWGSTDATQTNLPPDLTNIVAVSRNALHCLALRRDGTIVAWGNNDADQTNAPSFLTNVTAIAAGTYHSLALRSDGTIVAWGAIGFPISVGSHGEFATEVVNYGQTAVPHGLSNVVAIAAGMYHTLALKSDGTVVALGPTIWDLNSVNYGQATVPSTLSNVVAIAAGDYHSLALKSDGTVVAFGAGSASPTNILADPNYGQSFVPNGLSHVVAIAAGRTFSLALKDDGSVVGWGANGSGQLGIQGVQHAVAISAGTFHSLALVNEGPPLLLRPQDQTLYTGMSAVFAARDLDLPAFPCRWQFNGTDLPGATNHVLTISNLRVSDAGTYTAIVTNSIGASVVSANLQVLSSAPSILVQPQNQVVVSNSPALLSANVAGSWPLSFQWQLNGAPVAGATTSSLSLLKSQSGDYGPYRLVATNSLGSVTSSVATLHVLKSASFVIGWGLNNFGQTNVPLDQRNVQMLALAAGSNHSVALRPDGSVVTWGDYRYNQTNLPQTYNVTAIAAGAYHSLALRANGTVCAWGAGDAPPGRDSGFYYGQAFVPLGLSGVTSVAAGRFHSLALRSNGTVVAWGNNDYGQTNVPSTLTNAIAISAGARHSIALRSDGTVAGWGDNTWRQTNAPSSVTNVIAIAAGDFHNLALRADGTVAAWGNSATVPAGLSNVVAIAAGQGDSFALRSDGTLSAWGDNGYNKSTVPAGLTNVVAVAGGAMHTLALTYGGAPFIIRPPTNQTVLAGQTVTFTQIVLGLPPLTYQWQFGGMDLPGATNSSLTVLDPQTAGNYTVVVRNNYGTAVSPPARLTILPAPPFFKTQPESQPFLLRSTVDLAPQLGGSEPLAYQWRLNGNDLPGATNAVLTLTNAQLSDAGIYSLFVSNIYGTALSSNALLAQVPATIFAWGYNGYGQTNIPKIPKVVTALAAGLGHNLALCADGTVVAWGTNDSGQATVPAGLTNVVEIAAGPRSSFALRSDGSLVGWGQNIYGQTNTPPAGLSNVVAIAAGSLVNIALRSDSSVVTWGSSYDAGNSVPIGLTNVTAVGAGFSQSLALRRDGSVSVWIGDYPFAPHLEPVPAELTNALSVAGMGYDNLAVRSDGIVAAWGTDTSYGQTNVPRGLNNIIAIAGGQYHALALKNDGTLVAWGAGTNSTGSPHFGQSQIPAGLHNVIAIAAGSYHNLALVGDGSPYLFRPPQSQSFSSGEALMLSATVLGTAPLSYQWQRFGTNIPGATSSTLSLANAQTSDSGAYTLLVTNLNGAASNTVAVQVQDSAPLFTLQPTSRSFLANTSLRVVGQAAGSEPMAYQWQLNGNDIPAATDRSLWLTNAQAADAGDYVLVASNAFGMARSSSAALVAVHSMLVAWGDNTYGQANAPSILDDVVQISAGLYHSLALTRHGEVVGWGAGQDTNLTVFNYGQATIPQGLSNVLAVSARGVRSVALTTRGALVGWGNDLDLTNTPPEATNLIAVAAGGEHNLALRGDGTVLAWGDNSYHQTNLPANLHAVAIAAGANYNLALRPEGTVAAWGDNSYGQTNVPSNLSNVVAISAGDDHCLALKADGTLAAWGDNAYKESTIPSGLSNVVAIAAGDSFSLALRSDGSIVAWGVNYEGQTNVPSSLPFAAGIAGGAEHGAAIVTDGSPFIVRVPFTQTLSSGTNATLSAQAIGSLPLSYQWQFNGVNISGATDATLNLTNISTGAAGNYRVWVTNALGSAQSPGATLTVHRTTPYFRSLPGVPALTGGNFQCEIAGLSGHGPLVVYSSTNLADWVPIFTNSPTAGTIDFLAPIPAGPSTRFYRAVEQ